MLNLDSRKAIFTSHFQSSSVKMISKPKRMPNSGVRTRKTTVDPVGRRYPCTPDISECPRWIFGSVCLITFDMKLC